MGRLGVWRRPRKNADHIRIPGNAHHLLSFSIEWLKLVIVDRPIIADAVQAMKLEIIGMKAVSLAEPAIRSAAQAHGEIPGLITFGFEGFVMINVGIVVMIQLPFMAIMAPSLNDQEFKVFLSQGFVEKEAGAKTRSDNDDIEMASMDGGGRNIVNHPTTSPAGTIVRPNRITQKALIL